MQVHALDGNVKYREAAGVMGSVISFSRIPTIQTHPAERVTFNEVVKLLVTPTQSHVTSMGAPIAFCIALISFSISCTHESRKNKIYKLLHCCCKQSAWKLETCGSNHLKVGMSYSVIHLNLTSLFEWCVVRCGSKNGHQKISV